MTTVRQVLTFTETLQRELAQGASEEGAIKRALDAVIAQPVQYRIGAWDEVFTIQRTSTRCGGNWAWMKQKESGAREMVGCICHTLPTEPRPEPEPARTPLQRLLIEALSNTETDHLVTNQAVANVAEEMERYLTQEQQP